MSTKNYEGIALIIQRCGRSGRAFHLHGELWISFDHLVNALCKMFTIDNPNFKEELFRAACLGDPLAKKEEEDDK